MSKQLYKNIILLVLTGIYGFVCFAQITKGVTSDDNATSATGKTRALIIGISKYQYIESLQYADKDAEEFSHFLSSNRFWNIPSEDIKLLTDENAKCGDIISELARLTQVSQPGDKVLFYFSGHGDVETITQFNNGFLLANDTYKNNYITGAIPISFLKEVFVTLLNKDIRVFMFTDACRSGKLAGGLKGTEFAASAISSIWKNEIKILSSQPGQLSYEDKKWGDGRGVFSYYLTQGLSGLADQNKDSIITISELERYVGENVSAATNNRQQPIFEGPNKFSTPIAKVYPKKNTVKRNGGNSFNYLKNNFISVDSCLLYYQLFTKAVQQNLFDAASSSATGLYHKLKDCKIENDLLYRANSKLMSALMNQTQMIINRSLSGERTDQQTFQKGIQMIDQILLNNDIKIPFENHFKNLKTFMYVMNEVGGNDSSKQKMTSLKKMLDDALLSEPDAAYLFYARGIVNIKMNRIENAISSLEQALKYSPTWQLPKDQLNIYTNLSKQNTASQKQKISFGVKSGVNFSILKFKDAHTNNKIGFHAGAFAQIYFKNKVAIQPELTYSSEGGKEPLAGATGKIVYNFNYINFTVLLKYYITQKLSLQTGPQIGYLVTANQKVDSRTTDIKSNYTSTDVSYVAGLSYIIKSGLGIEGRWNVGLKNINKISSSTSTKNNVGQLGLFYRF